MAASKISLKLLIDSKSDKVLFAEAGKDFVDFLFHLLSLPVGTVVKLLKNRSMVGCLGQLYQSVETLNESYMQPNKNKNSLLNPISPVSAPEISLLLSDTDKSEVRLFYTCPGHSGFNRHLCLSDDPTMRCPSCNEYTRAAMSFVSPAAAKTGTAVAEVGFVKGLVNYMVMDNLEVKPMSTISCITSLNTFNVKNLGSLEERVVDFGVDEGLKLLKASLESKNVLTSVFLYDSEV